MLKQIQEWLSYISNSVRYFRVVTDQTWITLQVVAIKVYQALQHAETNTRMAELYKGMKHLIQNLKQQVFPIFDGGLYAMHLLYVYGKCSKISTFYFSVLN